MNLDKCYKDTQIKLNLYFFRWYYKPSCNMHFVDAACHLSTYHHTVLQHFFEKCPQNFQREVAKQYTFRENTSLALATLHSSPDGMFSAPCEPSLNDITDHILRPALQVCFGYICCDRGYSSDLQIWPTSPVEYEIQVVGVSASHALWVSTSCLQD